MDNGLPSPAEFTRINIPMKDEVGVGLMNLKLCFDGEALSSLSTQIQVLGGHTPGSLYGHRGRSGGDRGV